MPIHIILSFHRVEMKARMETMNEIAMFKYTQQLDMLESAVGTGTSLITLFIPGTMTQLHHIRQKLDLELGSASNIKDRVNRHNV
jgi:peptide subunit release factor 1 (eRF1)